MVYDGLPLYRSSGRNRRYHGPGVVADHDELVYHHHTASASASSSSSSSCPFASAVAAVVVPYTTKQQSAHDARECNATTENRLGVVVGVGDDRVAQACRRRQTVGGGRRHRYAATVTACPLPR